MNKTMKFLLNLCRLLVVVQLVMGVAMWMGQGAGFVNAHMGLGLLFVVLVIALAAMAGAAGAPKSLVWVTVIWGIITVAVGMGQMRVMVGESHWIIRLVHLFLGLGMQGQAERIGRALKR
jgi:hypothetical protein